MQRLLPLGLTSLLAFGTFACSGAEDPPSRDGGRSLSGDSGNSAVSAAANAVSGGSSSSGGINPTEGSDPDSTCGSSLPVVYRDFKGAGESAGHPDFEISSRESANGEPYRGWNDVGCGLVEPTLGADSKPVFFGGAPDIAEGGPSVPVGVGRQQRVVSGPGCWTEANPTPPGICNIGICKPWAITPPVAEIQNASTFNQWYNTIGGLNMEIISELPLTDDGTGTKIYDSTAFFPIDGQGFGNTPGQAHNYHFTTEAHVSFTYESGQVFTFRGDDDLWIFVNGKLALDVGGLHQALEGSIIFDAQAAELGITPGQQYQMDIFHAERQTSESNFRIQTNITCFEPVDIIK